MKNRIFNILGCIIIITFLITMGYAWIDGYYPTTFIVDTVDYETDIVTVIDSQGFVYEWNGCEDWIEGEIASAMMHNNFTKYIDDDRIVKLHYSGWSK